MNGKLKSALKFLVCAPAFSQRNITSIGLVVMFLLVYVMAGGKVTTSLPKMPSSKSAFGVPGKQNLRKKNLNTRQSKSVLGEIRSAKRNDADIKRAKIGSLFTDEEVKDSEQEKIDPNGLVKGHKFVNRKERRLLEKSRKRAGRDSLSAIEERLKSRNHTYLLDQ